MPRFCFDKRTELSRCLQAPKLYNFFPLTVLILSSAAAISCCHIFCCVLVIWNATPRICFHEICSPIRRTFLFLLMNIRDPHMDTKWTITVEQRETIFLCCQKSLGKRLWCWARLMERLFDFWRDWGQQIEPCELPKWHGQHQRLPATRGHGFSYEPSYCAVGSSRPAPCSQDVGSGLSPGGRKEGEKYRGGWRLCSGMQWTRRFGPSTCHSTALGHCTV